MPTIAEVRQQYPQYSDMSDADLAGALHTKFYSDVPREEFDKKIGLAPAEPAKKKFGLEDTWPARLAKGIYSAVTLPGDVAQGNISMTGEDGHTNPEVINRSAELASVASPMSPAARSGIGWAGALKTKPAPAPTEEMLASASNAGYDAARNSPFEMQANAVSDWASKVRKDLEAEGRLQEFAPDTHAVLKKLESGGKSTEPDIGMAKALGDAFDESPQHFIDLQAPKETGIATAGNLISAREALREASRNFTNPREKSAAEIAIRELDRFIERPPEEAVLGGSATDFSKTAGDARGNYAAKKRSELLAQALEFADQNAAAANSGANVGNAERAKLRQIYQSDKKSAGFTDEELAQVDKIVRGTPVSNGARALGNALGGGGGLGGAVTAGLGAAATSHMGGIGAVAPLVGYGMKKYSDRLGQNEINLLQEMVRRRSPLGKSMPEKMTAETPPSRTALARALLLGAAPQQ